MIKAGLIGIAVTWLAIAAMCGLIWLLDTYPVVTVASLMFIVISAFGYLIGVELFGE